MLEFPDKGNINWLLEKRELTVSYCMDSQEGFRKRKRQDSLANDELVESEPHNSTASSFDQKRRRLREASTCNNNNEEGYNHHRMRLDLELNLSPSLIDLNHHHDHDLGNHNKNCEEDEKKKNIMKEGSMLGLDTRRNMAWVAFDLDEDRHGRRGGDSGGSKAELVARVCMKCHMLVMLCKASPACPNCKFMHSPEDTSLSLLFNPKPTLLA
ncbi:hypothetical protein AALP_AA6G199400 [Arabis alpina]|uniref:Uncharacterized protein n=1 Tax=Arabis alpina TaxID=50452 RepID=A0A087GQF3_ARAAL|nr:hypothetical protein AALP_AA6G199400 [Arabis alpina]